MKLLFAVFAVVIALSAVPVQAQEGAICPPGDGEVCAPGELWSPPVYLPVVASGEPQNRQVEPAQFPRLWLPIVGAFLAAVESAGFDCDYLDANPTVVPDLMRRWGVPEEDIPPVVTCDSIYFNTPDPVPIPELQQLDTLIIQFRGNPAGWWCVAAVRLNVGAAILYWHQDPPVGPPATAGYECKDVHNGCYWIAMGRPARNSRITDVTVRGNMPTRAYATCFPAP